MRSLKSGHGKTRMRVHVIHILLFGGVCIPLMLTYFFAALNAAWPPKEKSREQQEEKSEKEPDEKQRIRNPFTFFKFLAGIAVIGVVIALLLPAVPASRESARRMSCSNNLKQIGLAFHTYHDKYGHFPPAFTVDEDGKPLHSWRVLILPYIEQSALFEKIRLVEPWDSEHNRQFHAEAPRIFQCPSNSRGHSDFQCPTCLHNQVAVPGGTSYSVIVGEETAFTGSQPKGLKDMTDGPSNTIVLVERRSPVNWMDPLSEIPFETACKGINVDAMGISSYHPECANVAYGDGSVEYLSNTTNSETLRKMLRLASEKQ